MTAKGGSIRFGHVGTVFAWLILGLIFMTPTALSAQNLEANYPLLTDLADTTGNYGDVILSGNPDAPDPPAEGSPVCHNGVYKLDTGGQEITTPPITGLDSTDFQLNVDFQLSSLPEWVMPIIVGGQFGRWIAPYIDSQGKVGAKYNNSFITWSDAVVTPGSWYGVELRFQDGELQIVLDGLPVHRAEIGPLETGGNYDFTTNDYSNAAALNGCIRYLQFINGTEFLEPPPRAIPLLSTWGFVGLFLVLGLVGAMTLRRMAQREAGPLN